MASQISHIHFPALDQRGRRDATFSYRLALKLDPESGDANNNLAWALVSVPDDPWFDPVQGLGISPEGGRCSSPASGCISTRWAWPHTATGIGTPPIEVLQESITFTGGAAHDLFFLAMTYWQEGNKKEGEIFL